MAKLTSAERATFAQDEGFKRRVMMVALELCNKLLRKRGVEETLRTVCKDIMNNPTMGGMPGGGSERVAWNVASILEATTDVDSDTKLQKYVAQVLDALAGAEGATEKGLATAPTNGTTPTPTP